MRIFNSSDFWGLNLCSAAQTRDFDEMWCLIFRLWQHLNGPEISSTYSSNRPNCSQFHQAFQIEKGPENFGFRFTPKLKVCWTLDNNRGCNRTSKNGFENTGPVKAYTMFSIPFRLNLRKCVRHFCKFSFTIGVKFLELWLQNSAKNVFVDQQQHLHYLFIKFWYSSQLFWLLKPAR